MSDNLIDTSQVCKLAGFSRSTLYRFMKNDFFPSPVPDISNYKKPIALFWLADIVIDWICNNNPSASAGKIVKKSELAKECNLSYSWINILSKHPSFPKSIMSRGGAMYYNGDEVRAWIKGRKFRKKKSKEVVDGL